MKRRAIRRTWQVPHAQPAQRRARRPVDAQRPVPDMRGLLRMYDAGMGRDPVPREPPDPLAPRKSEHIRPLDLS